MLIPIPELFFGKPCTIAQIKCSTRFSKLLENRFLNKSPNENLQPNEKCATNQSHHVIRIGPLIRDINLISKSVNNVGIDRKIHDYSKQV